jgi:exopolysaccharide production protein ExoZ
MFDKSNSVSTSSRIEAIQALRGIAALGVNFAHLSVSFAYVFGLKKAIPDFFIGNAGVDLFFVISGFIIVYASEKLFATLGARSSFFVRRVIRIVPLYWLATSFQVFLFYQLERLDLYSPLWRSIVASFLFLPIPRSDGAIVPILQAGWTLNFEMIFYLIFTVSIARTRDRAVVISSLFLIALVIFGLAFGHSLQIYLTHFTNPLVLEFLMGTWIALAFRHQIFIERKFVIPLIVVGACLIYFSPSNGAQNLFRVSTWGLGSAAIVAGAALGRINSISPWNPLVLVGEASYSIYLTHWFVLITPPAFISNTIPPAGHPFLYAIVIMTAVLAVGFLTYYLVERPLTRALHSYLPKHEERRLRPA